MKKEYITCTVKPRAMLLLLNWNGHIVKFYNGFRLSILSELKEFDKQEIINMCVTQLVYSWFYANN